MKKILLTAAMAVVAICGMAQGKSAPANVTFVQMYYGGPEWASMNLGATSETDGGLYFWWGDTKGNGKSANFDFSDKNNAITTKASTAGVVEEDRLVPGKDAVMAKWGSPYRMPTADELKALKENCTWEWKENYNGVAGANGYLVLGKGDYEGNSIFIPAAGEKSGAKLNGEGKDGKYWSSSPCDNSNNSFALSFVGKTVNADKESARWIGCTIRPVMGL